MEANLGKNKHTGRPNQSIHSKIGKTREQKARKAALHAENARNRADLHKEKHGFSGGTNMNGAAAVQVRIDQISRKHGGARQ